VITKAGMNQPN